MEEKRRAEEEALRLQLEREEEEWRKQIEELERKRQEQEEVQRRKVAAEREAREKELKLEEERRQKEVMLREELLAFNDEKDVQQQQEEEEEEEVWLRGDVFQMFPQEPEEPDLEPSPIPKPPAAAVEEVEKMETELDGVEEREAVVNNRGLPPGCDISDVTLTCDNAKLTYFPPLSIPELKSLSLEGKLQVQFNWRYFYESLLLKPISPKINLLVMITRQ